MEHDPKKPTQGQRYDAVSIRAREHNRDKQRRWGR